MSSAEYEPYANDVAVDGGEAVIALRGELDLTSVDGLDARLRELRADGVASVVIDLRGLTFMDSAGLRMLMSARNDAKRDGYALRLVPGRREVQRVFDLTGTQTLFDWS